MKNALIFGLLAGLIVVGLMFAFSWTGEMNFEGGEIKGYAGMIVGMLLIFFGVKQYRDKQLGGHITFGKAFLHGLLITFFAGIIYVLGWEYYYNTSASDFMQQYSAYMLDQAREAGASKQELTAQKAEMESMQEWYSLWSFRALMTFMEIFPVGLIFSLGSAFVLKKQNQ